MGAKEILELNGNFRSSPLIEAAHRFHFVIVESSMKTT
jgi:hypothetical protein